MHIHIYEYVCELNFWSEISLILLFMIKFETKRCSLYQNDKDKTMPVYKNNALNSSNSPVENL